MTWDEFTTLLTGILPETPLGYIVGIRSENDREKLKSFTPEQKGIRNAWRTRNVVTDMSPVEAANTVQEIQNIFKQMFGGGEIGG